MSIHYTHISSYDPPHPRCPSLGSQRSVGGEYPLDIAKKNQVSLTSVCSPPSMSRPPYDYWNFRAVKGL